MSSPSWKKNLLLLSSGLAAGAAGALAFHRFRDPYASDVSIRNADRMFELLRHVNGCLPQHLKEELGGPDHDDVVVWEQPSTLNI